eukprot:TRINITY_DN84514_c0_g1_i1.p1 TRINITY_DN84514_c0_g1~~TRINITY_DN84514_c0_g1_i1.p1  ORF type:complete len:481 (-),score=70.02 TRINITY_DN84514_c0_g1_i1:53-1495(-)
MMSRAVALSRQQASLNAARAVVVTSRCTQKRIGGLPRQPARALLCSGRRALAANTGPASASAACRSQAAGALPAATVLPSHIGDGAQPAERRSAARGAEGEQTGVIDWKAYWQLSKGKLTVWVSLSAMPGYFLALPGAIDPVVMAALGVGTFMTSASAQTMNQIIEIPRDARMNRTAARPLPTGRLSTQEATTFAAMSGSVGLAVLSIGATPATAAVAAATMASYAAVYTPLKVRSPYNTHVGAIAGALPTLMGFTAALGGAGLLASPWAAHAAWIFGLQTLWQMPHFYALAWMHRADYIRGGYNMFPLTDTTGVATAAMSKPYLAALVAMPWVASSCGLASWMLPVGSVVPSLLWWNAFRAFERKPNANTCRKFFLHSLTYLLAMLGLFTAYAHVELPVARTQQEGEEAAAASESGTAKASAGSCGVFGHSPRGEVVGPSWRTAISETLYDACPHEKAHRWFFGIARDFCPSGSGGRAL